MNPSAAKLLLLVVAMLGIGGYVFYSTNAPSSSSKREVQQSASSTSGVLGANVTNVTIEGDGKRFTVVGLAQEAVDPELTSFTVTLQGPSLNLEPVTFTKMKADLLVQNRGIRGGAFEVDLTGVTLKQEALQREARESILEVQRFPSVLFVIRRVEKGEGSAAVLVGDLTLHGMTKEVRVPFARQGGSLRGKGELDPAAFNLKMPQGVQRILYTFSVGVK